jgi:hypothetical protein
LNDFADGAEWPHNNNINLYTKTLKGEGGGGGGGVGAMYLSISELYKLSQDKKTTSRASFIPSSYS